ncbi:hypothetical protein ACFLR1_06695, partial [Bacteroidota bacterium]
FQGDDGIDLDQNYAGTINGFAVLHGDGIGTDEGVEIDGPENATYTNGLFTLKNGLCKSVGATDGTPGDFKSKAQGTVENVTFDYSSVGGENLKIRASYVNCAGAKEDAFTHLTDGVPTLTFTNAKFAGVDVYTASDNAGVACVVPGVDQTAADAAMTSGTGGTIVPATLFSWTAAGLRSEL